MDMFKNRLDSSAQYHPPIMKGESTHWHNRRALVKGGAAENQSGTLQSIPVPSSPNFIESQFICTMPGVNSWINSTWGSVAKVTRLTTRAVKATCTIGASVALTVISRRQDMLIPILKLGGCIGKILERSSIHSNLNYAIEDNPIASDRNFLSVYNHLASKFPRGEIASKTIEASLEKQLPESHIKHIKTLGRGTLCQVDHIKIDGQSYAVKSLSPSLVKDFRTDCELLFDVIAPVMQYFHHCHCPGAADTVGAQLYESLARETDLLNELENAKKASKALQGLSNLMFIYLADHPGERQVPVRFKTPEVFAAFSSKDALVMEFVDGCSLDRTNEVRQLLQTWTPPWNDTRQLNEYQVAKIIDKLMMCCYLFYLHIAKEKGFLNAGFHMANFVLKLEHDNLEIYLVDHGNCFEVENLEQEIHRYVNSHINYSIIVSMVHFFHQRYNLHLQQTHKIKWLLGQIHDISSKVLTNMGLSRFGFNFQQNGSEIPDTTNQPLSTGLSTYYQKINQTEHPFIDEDSLSQDANPTENPEDLLFKPLSSSQAAKLTNEIKEWEDLFKVNLNRTDYLKLLTERDMSIREACDLLYDWLQVDWRGPGKTVLKPSLSREKFAFLFTRLMMRTALLNEKTDFTSEKAIGTVAQIPFDRVAEHCGYTDAPENIMLHLVRQHLEIYRKYILFFH